MKPSPDVASGDGDQTLVEEGLSEITDHLEEAIRIARDLRLDMLEHFLKMAAFETGTLIAGQLRKHERSRLQ